MLKNSIFSEYIMRFKVIEGVGEWMGAVYKTLFILPFRKAFQ